MAQFKLEPALSQVGASTNSGALGTIQDVRQSKLALANVEGTVSRDCLIAGAIIEGTQLLAALHSEQQVGGGVRAHARGLRPV